MNPDDRETLLLALETITAAAETLLGSEENAPSYQDDVNALDDACALSREVIARVVGGEE